jgi:two-component system sensor histidine kinase MtrB
VEKEQISGRLSDIPYTMPTTLLGANGQPLGPALAVGVPISADDQLYYLFPLAQQMQVLSLVQNTLILAGAGLVLLLAVIVSLVTRWVVVPIRQAAQAASRVSAGNLDERMAARGTDDLAALANSFNEMAASLQDKLRELEELSSVQRQFVSDVSHELRTPLTTIRIAADVLFGSSEALDPAARRSAELLQGQLERFEALLSDLLEISRHDANVATLDAESADVCDLVLRAAADAEQLAAQRETRIEFRLPPGQCIAEVDRRRVERVLRNLLDNAVEHGEDATWWSSSPPTGTRWRSRSVIMGLASVPASTSSSSTGSGAPTLPGPGPPAGPGWAWPSPWRTPDCTRAGCRPGGSGGGARSSG